MNGTPDTHLFSKTNCFLEIHNLNLKDFVTIQNATIFMCAVNSLTAVLAVITNGLIIATICQTSALRSPGNTLLCCLALTDFLSGLVTQPAFVLDKVARMKDNADLFCAAASTTFVSGYVLSGVSFLTLTAISTERLLALKLHLRYPQFVNSRRVLFVEASIWIACCLVVILPFVGRMNIFQMLIAIFGVASLILNLFTYSVIFCIVKKHQQRINVEIQLARHFHGRMAVGEMRKLKHSSWTLALVCFLYFLCYVPFIGIKIVENFSLESTSLSLVLAQEMNETLILIIACVNPVVYCFRLRDLRRAVWNIVKCARKS